MNNEKIHKIMDLCLEAKTRGHDCFLNYSGHVDRLQFHIHLFGWSREVEPEYKIDIKLTYPNADNELNEVIVYLEDVISGNDRNTKLNDFRRKLSSILILDESNIRDYELSILLTKMELEFSIPALKDERYNEENPDVMELYQNISNERSFIKALKA